jgi:predicted O-methyltransferase YrrM
MIIRRSGMEKILNHIKDNGLYLPIDHEIAFADEINLYVTSEVFITYADSISDIKPQTAYVPNFTQSEWDIYKCAQLANLDRFSGWCDQEKANHLMNFLYQYKPKICVEIGTFGGSTTFPILSALKYIKQGQLFTIDAWDNEKAIKGFEPTNPNYIWWSALDFKQIHEKFTHLITQMGLKDYCTVIHSPSQEAAASFADDSVDLVYIDGNFSLSGSLDDVKTYFPKVKPGGYIWLNNGSSPEKLPSVIYLMEHAFWLKKESIENKCLVFQKTNSK